MGQEIILIMRIIMFKGQIHGKKEILQGLPTPTYLWRG